MVAPDGFLNHFGIKWNPFARDLPASALVIHSTQEHFFWRIENLLLQDGGFGLIVGEPGTGKSATLRLLHQRFSKKRDIKVGIIDRPQSSVADFYRELGDAFGVTVGASNRWGGFKLLRERWRHTLESTLHRPVLLVDEAQEMSEAVLSELRILGSDDFDSCSLLTVILAGDMRLPDRFRDPALLPLASRIRARLHIEPYSQDELRATLIKLLDDAGNPNLFTDEVITALAEHALGNFRSLGAFADELLVQAYAEDRSAVDQDIFLRTFGGQTKDKRRAPKKRR